MKQEEKHIQDLLTELLQEDRQMLGNKDELLSSLKERAGQEYKREYTPIQRALQETNIGEKLLIADQGTVEEKEAAEAEAKNILLQSGIMQENRAELVLEILVGALGWHQDLKTEAEAEAEDLEKLMEASGDSIESEADRTWDCVCGCKKNRKKFCKDCGRSRELGEVKEGGIPDEIWTCSKCGKTGNKLNFCVNCGAPRESEKTAEEAPVESEAVIESEGSEVVQELPQKEVSVSQPSDQQISQSANVPMTPNLVQQPVMQPQTPASGTNGTQRAIIGVIALLLCFLAFMGFKEYSAESGTSTSSIYQPLTKNSESGSKEKPQLAVKSDLSLGGMELDETMDDMYKKLGKESYTKSDDGETYYYYKGSVRVGFTDGKVTSLVSDGNTSSTKRGIHEGSSLQEVIKAYGDSETKFKYEDLELYEYDAKSLAGREGILRFAINSKGQVEYISVRIPQENKMPPQTIGNAAKDVVVSYHRYITNRDYKSAYNLLTPDMQNTIGLFENWVKGFHTTVESRATDLQVASVQGERVEINFILMAKDKRQGGGYEEKKYRSTVTVVNTAGGWKIAAMKNKKI